MGMGTMTMEMIMVTGMIRMVMLTVTPTTTLMVLHTNAFPIAMPSPIAMPRSCA